MPAHNSYSLPSYRAKLRSALLGNTNGVVTLISINQGHRILWTQEMLLTLFQLYSDGRALAYIAEELGVGRQTLERKMNALGLPRGRWFPLSQRKAALEELLKGK